MQKNANNTQFFYQNGKLVTLKTGEQGRSIFRSSDVPLAEQQSDGTHTSGLLVTDDKGSVLQVREKKLNLRRHCRDRTRFSELGPGGAFHKSVAFHPALRRCSRDR